MKVSSFLLFSSRAPLTLVVLVTGQCCTQESPCSLGEGDCQQDEDCRDDLVTSTLIVMFSGLRTLFLQDINFIFDIITPKECLGKISRGIKRHSLRLHIYKESGNVS